MAKGPLVKCMEPGTTCLFQTANGWWWKCEALLTDYIKRMSSHHRNFQKRAISPYDSCLCDQLVHIKSLRLSATKEAAKRPRWFSGISCILTKLRGTWRSGTKRQVWRPVQWKVCTYKQQDNGKNSWRELVWKGQISTESHRNENHQTADFLSKDRIQNEQKFLHSFFLQGEHIWNSQIVEGTSWISTILVLAAIRPGFPAIILQLLNRSFDSQGLCRQSNGYGQWDQLLRCNLQALPQKLHTKPCLPSAAGNQTALFLGRCSNPLCQVPPDIQILVRRWVHPLPGMKPPVILDVHNWSYTKSVWQLTPILAEDLKWAAMEKDILTKTRQQSGFLRLTDPMEVGLF